MNTETVKNGSRSLQNGALLGKDVEGQYVMLDTVYLVLEWDRDSCEAHSESFVNQRNANPNFYLLFLPTGLICQFF